MQLKRIILSILFFAVLSGNSALAASSNWVDAYENSAKSRLIGSFYEKDGTKKLIAGLHFKIKKGWKIYGLESNGFGLPPQISFKNSTNYKSHQIIWPEPKIAREKIGDERIVYSYYNKEVVLPIEIDVKNLTKNAELNLQLNYGICKDICIPASAKFSLKIDQNIDESALVTIQQFYPDVEITKVKSDIKSDSSPIKTMIYAVIFGIIGGAILNIMPCVLPVLSIKLISIVDHSRAPLSQVRMAFIATTLGILFSFIFFAFFTIAVTSAGHSLGWGLQFQDPYFLIFLIVILTLFTANLLGLFEISFQGFLANFLNKKISKNEEDENVFIPNFLSGILAVLLSTPCSAPFLGSAISFALVSSPLTILMIFLAIGIGFALPYIIFTISPKLVTSLPRPGEWMNKVKKLMALFLVITVAWLLYVLAGNIGGMAALVATLFTVLVLFSFKIKSQFFKAVAVGLLIIATFALPADFRDYRKSQTVSSQKYDAIWQKFSEEKINENINRGKVVLVDITADWCLTCKFNKYRVLHSNKIMQLLESGEIIGLRADITKPDQKILKFMEGKKRFAIPFNAVYGPNAKKGLLTSELLSKKDLLELIQQAK